MCVVYSYYEMCCLYVFQGDYYGVDWDGFVLDVSLDDEILVEVFNIINLLELVQYLLFINLINFLCNSDEYGVDIYLEVLIFF